MEEKYFTDGLKVGDRVVLQKWGYAGNSNYYIKEIQSITKTGLLRVDGSLFYKDGRARGDCRCAILPLTEENAEKVYDTRKRKTIEYVRGKIVQANITYEQAEKILEIMGW